MKNAIVLCSGGLDSVVCSYQVKRSEKYKNIKILFFDYGQRALKVEKRLSEKCAVNLESEFIEIKLPELKNISNSLMNKAGSIKKVWRKDLKNSEQISKTWYVPNRNTIFLGYAFALAESEYIDKGKINDIFVGFTCEGEDSYPDTTKKFVNSINRLSHACCSQPFKLKAPLIERDKEDIVILGNKLGVDFNQTFSCYVKEKKHCGYCLACRLRQEGFYWANIKDPTDYEEKMSDYRLANN